LQHDLPRSSKIKLINGYERHIESLREENKKLVDHYRKVADDQKENI